MIAFSPVIAEAIAIAYKGASADIQGKLRRVIDVWKERSIFEVPIQSAIETRLQELDKARGNVKSGFGGSPFGSNAPSVPSEFAPLISAHQTVGKLSVPLKSTVSAANEEFDKQTDPTTAQPSAPVYAARLTGLLKTLANAESAVAECVKAREGLISGLEKLLEANRTALDNDKNAALELAERKQAVEDTKQQVELAYLRVKGSIDGSEVKAEDGSGSPAPEPDRPEMEALTPPPMESFTPPEMEALTPPNMDDPEPVFQTEPEPELSAAAEATLAAKSEPHSDGPAAYQSVTISTNGSNKRRRVEDADDFPDLGADDGIDADVAEMLRKDSS
jgi:regulator of Ty1 transposition protein 103